MSEPTTIVARHLDDGRTIEVYFQGTVKVASAEIALSVSPPGNFVLKVLRAIKDELDRYGKVQFLEE